MDKPMEEGLTYQNLIKEAERIYHETSINSPLCAFFDAREYIASKIDECIDRDEHMDVLEWDEYKNKYAPMSRAEYNLKKDAAKRCYEEELRKIGRMWQERGRKSPDWHKI